MEQNSTRCHSSAEQDTLYIETEKAEFEIIYRLCLNQQGRKNVVYELKTSDDSSIDFVQSYMVNGIRKLDCFVVYDNVADGNRFLFYDYESRVIHMNTSLLFRFLSDLQFCRFFKRGSFVNKWALSFKTAERHSKY